MHPGQYPGSHDVAAKEKNPFVPNFGTHMTPSRLQYTVVGIQKAQKE